MSSTYMSLGVTASSEIFVVYLNVKAACHCIDCQQSTGASNVLNIELPRGDVELKGPIKEFSYAVGSVPQRSHGDSREVLSCHDIPEGSR